MARQMKFRGKMRKNQSNSQLRCLDCGGNVKLGLKNDKGGQRYCCVKCEKTLDTCVIKSIV
jgi:hypothetical protein